MAADVKSSAGDSAAGGTKLMDLPVDADGRAICCDLCGKTSLDPSPFEDAFPDDVYGGLWPWHRYQKSPCRQCKLPRDKTCLICYCTFAHSSLRLKHDGVKGYLLQVRGAPDEHVAFRKATKRLINMVQQHEGGYIEGLKRASVKQVVEKVFEDPRNASGELKSH